MKSPSRGCEHDLGVCYADVRPELVSHLKEHTCIPESKLFVQCGALGIRWTSSARIFSYSVIPYLFPYDLAACDTRFDGMPVCTADFEFSGVRVAHNSPVPLCNKPRTHGGGRGDTPCTLWPGGLSQGGLCFLLCSNFKSPQPVAYLPVWRVVPCRFPPSGYYLCT